MKRGYCCILVMCVSVLSFLLLCTVFMYCFHCVFVLLPRASVITATSDGKMETLTPCKIETIEQIDTQFVVSIDYVHERNVCSKFGKNPFTGQRGEI